MKNSVMKELTRIAVSDPRIYLLSGDLGYVVLDEFRAACPDRYINVGIAEQNMAAIAAGMSHEGSIVFLYSIGNFPTLRCMEQIRNDICYHKANVKILAVGGGFSYGNQGVSHHATEDIAMMRVLPNMHVYAPGDSTEAVACLQDAYEYDGPCYIRLSKSGNCPYIKNGLTEINKIHKIEEGDGEIAIITVGSVLSEGMKLRSLLNIGNRRAALFSAPKLKPIDKEGIIRIALESKLVVTIEEHQISGGLGGICAEIFSGIHRRHALLYRVGLEDTFSEIVGDEQYLRDYYGISAVALLPALNKVLVEIEQ